MSFLFLFFFFSLLTIGLASYLIYHLYFVPTEIDAKDKLVLVTGAAGGIGSQVVSDLVARGCEVIACDINLDRLNDLYRDQASKVHIEQVDVTSVKEIGDLGQRVRQKYCTNGRTLFGLVNNVGIGPTEVSSLVDKSEEQMMKMVNINLLAAHRFVREFFPCMTRLQPDSVQKTEKQRNEFIGGSIVNISSVLASSFPGFISFYPTTKAAVACYSDSLRRELRYKKVRVSYIQPGAIQTPIWKPPPVESNSEFAKELPIIGEAQKKIDELKKQPPSVVSDCILKCLFTCRNSGYDGIEYMIAESNWFKYLSYRFLPLFPIWVSEWYFRQIEKPWFILG